MFFAKNSLRSYIGLYQKFLHKIFVITETSPPDHCSQTSPAVTKAASVPSITVLCDPQTNAPVRSGQCTFTNALLTQQLDNLCMTHLAQVTRRSLSYEAVSSLLRPYLARPSIVPRYLRMSGRRG